jgi:hypothetical protein
VRANEYPIASGYAVSIFRGDVVQMTTDGSIIQAEAGNVDNLGVFNGVSYVNASGSQVWKPYWLASTVATNIKASVYDDPMIIYAIQSDATGAAAVDVGQLAEWEVVAGSALTGQSAWNLDVSAGLASTAKALRILRFPDDGVNVAGAYSIVEVLFAEHVMKGVVSGVGGI